MEKENTMKRLISLAMAILLAASLLAMGAIPAAADESGCPFNEGGPHIYIRFLLVNADRQYLICETGCGAIYYATHPIVLTSFNKYKHESRYSNRFSGDTVARHLIDYRTATKLPSPTMEGYNFRYEVTQGEDYIELGLISTVYSKKSFVKVSRNKVAAICDLGSVEFDVEVRPNFPFQWFIIIFGFGWIWW